MSTEVDLGRIVQSTNVYQSLDNSNEVRITSEFDQKNRLFYRYFLAFILIIILFILLPPKLLDMERSLPSLIESPFSLCYKSKSYSLRTL